MSIPTSRFAPRFALHLMGLVALFAFSGATAGASPGDTAAATPTSSFSGNYLAGRHAQRSHDTISAAALLGMASQMAPKNTDLLRRTYVLALSDGRIVEAVEILAKLKKLKTAAPLQDIVVAAHAIRTGRYKDVDKAFGKKPSGISAFLAPTFRAWARFGESDAKGAMDAIAALKDQRGGLAFMHMNEGLLSDLADDVDAAERHYLAAKKESGLSLKLALFLGGLYERNGQSEKALGVYHEHDNATGSTTLYSTAKARIAKGGKHKREVNTAAEGVAEALFSLASSLANQSVGESAMATAQLSLYMRPAFAPAMTIVAGAYESFGQHEKANAVYARIPITDVMSWSVRLKAAENMDRLGQQAKAEKILNALADERPTEARPLIELGDVLRRHEAFEGAAKAYTRALERIKTVEERHWAIFYSRGVAYERSKRWSEAEADLKKALSMQPDQPLILNYLGYSWIEKRINLKEAVDMIKKAVSLRPRDGYIVDSLGWGLYRLGDYEGAAKHMERAVLLRPGDPIINDHFGDALWRIGREREARFQWKRSLGLKPDADSVKTIEEKLKSGLRDQP